MNNPRRFYLANNPIRIAQIVRPAVGGMRRHVSLLLANLGEKYDIALFAPADFTLEFEIERVDQKILDLPAKTAPAQDWRKIGTLADQLRGNYDLIHGHGMRGALYAVLAGQKARIPALFTAHNLIVNPNFTQKILIRYLVRNASACIAVSEAVRDSFDQCRTDRRKFHVISNGIDLQSYLKWVNFEKAYKQYDIQPGAPLILGAGRLSKEKGFDVLVRAMREVQTKIPDARLVIAGEGVEQAALKELASEHQIKVNFVGHVSDLVPLLRASDIVVIPSRAEGQGFVALEAMACAKPVAASDVGGLPQTVLNNRTGVLFPVGDSEALARTLVKLLNDPERRRELGAEGRVQVKKSYLLKDMIARTESLYFKIYTDNFNPS